jgi:co-chaperonin GroES (HSP10)
MMDFPMAVSQKTIKPFCHSVSVLESPVDEYETNGGIIVPTNYQGKLDVVRGVVVNVGPCPCEAWQFLEQGVVIYYYGNAQGVVKINDVWIVDHDNIIAFEEAS